MNLSLSLLSLAVLASLSAIPAAHADAPADAGTLDTVRVEAERAMNRALHGSCHVPVAGFAQWEGEDLFLQGLVGGVADGRLVRAEARGPGRDPDALGRQVAAGLLVQGLVGNSSKKSTHIVAIEWQAVSRATNEAQLNA